MKCCVFCIYVISFTLQNSFICLDLSLGSMLERLVSKNGVVVTSESVKWTSGARIMTIFGRSVARSLGRSLDRSVARSIARSLARSIEISYPARPGPVLRSTRPGFDYPDRFCAYTWPGSARFRAVPGPVLITRRGCVQYIYCTRLGPVRPGSSLHLELRTVAFRFLPTTLLAIARQ